MAAIPKNKDINAIHRAIGAAITKWTTIETHLHHVFGICLGLVARQRGGGFSFDSTTSSAVLNAIDGFRPKMLMIDAAMEGAASGLEDEADMLNEWAKLARCVRDAHQNRNSLAHWTVFKEFDDKGQEKRFVLKPDYASGRRKEGVTAADIEGWEKSFLAVSKRLDVFVMHLAGHRGLQRKHLQRVANQVHCTAPTDPTLLEVLKHELSDYL